MKYKPTDKMECKDCGEKFLAPQVLKFSNPKNKNDFFFVCYPCSKKYKINKFQ